MTFNQACCPKWHINMFRSKALHSELLAKLSGRFSSRNEYFRISEVWIVRHFFEVFGKFGISKFPKFLKFPNIRKNQYPKFPNFFRNYRTFYRTFPNFLTKKQVFLPSNLKFYIIFSKFSKFTKFSNNYRTFYQTWISELFSELFRENSASLKIPFFSEKFPKFENRTFPKLAKTKSSEISV